LVLCIAAHVSHVIAAPLCGSGARSQASARQLIAMSLAFPERRYNAPLHTV